jgi:hypothetical protein
MKSLNFAVTGVIILTPQRSGAFLAKDVPRLPQLLYEANSLSKAVIKLQEPSLVCQDNNGHHNSSCKRYQTALPALLFGSR